MDRALGDRATARGASQAWRQRDRLRRDLAQCDKQPSIIVQRQTAVSGHPGVDRDAGADDRRRCAPWRGVEGRTAGFRQDGEGVPCRHRRKACDQGFGRLNSLVGGSHSQAVPSRGDEWSRESDKCRPLTLVGVTRYLVSASASVKCNGEIALVHVRQSRGRFPKRLLGLPNKAGQRRV